MTVYAGGIEGGPAGYDTVTFNVTASSWNIAWPFSSSNSQYGEAVTQIIQATVQAATSETFLITASAILAFAVGIIIVFLILVSKKESKQKKQNRLVR